MNESVRQRAAELAAHSVWSGGPAEEQALSTSALDDSQLRQFLALHDGMVAFDGGFRCFGIGHRVLPSITAWNSRTGWRAAYRNLADGLLFFAEDVFGNQFALEEQRIVRFLAETAEREFLADSLAEWLGAILVDPEDELSLWLLREWKTPGNAVAHGEHLCPKIPFFMGGAYEAENLYVVDRNASMTSKGDLAWQTRNAPDGAKVRLKVID